MKLNQVLRYLLFASTLATPALLPPPAQAQSRLVPTTVNIPFDFRVGSSHLKAGTYRLNQPLSFTIRLRADHATGTATAIHEQSMRPSVTSRIVFHRYGNQYFLREVWTADSTDHLYVPASKEEKKLRADVLQASTTPQPNNVELALLEASY